ncbi:uncharacterized protein [Nothobranchius furzeri]|uniref:LOC107386795-like protein n=1 Tax=Nothobranchius furzeri TaxID=105023 RepID=A0A9D3BFV3_NOTFU|nr:putative LOC107386795-like protein [Nothobranchius furzeri]
MKPVYLIVSVLTATVLTKGSIECNFGDSTGTRQCHGAEGQQLIFHLSNETNTELKLIKDAKYRIFKKTENGTVTLDEKYIRQFDQIQKGKLNLGQATNRHTGQYLLEEYGFGSDDGKIMKKVEINLTIHAQVPKPTVSQVCFSPELMAVTCSSKGDGTEISMTVDDNVLIQSKHGQSLSSTGRNSRASSVSINIHGQLTGNLVCQVWNNYSRNKTIFPLTACKGSDIVIPVLACIVTTFVVLALGLLGVKLCKRTKPTPAKSGDNEEGIVYSDVKLKQPPQRPQSST